VQRCGYRLPLCKPRVSALDELVEVREEAGRIVIEPVKKKTYDLRKLLKGITRKNQHEGVDFGPAVGKEVW
jgi:antitoxin MazE